MSTKTTFKRIALVAVAALGLGVLSVAPSSAYLGTPTVTLSASTGSVLVNETTTVTATASWVSTVTNESFSVVVLGTGATGAASDSTTTGVTIQALKADSAAVVFYPGTETAVVGAAGETMTGTSGFTTTAKFTITIRKATVVGTHNYSVNLYRDNETIKGIVSSGASLVATATFALTVGAADTTATSKSKLFIKDTTVAYTGGTYQTRSDSTLVVSAGQSPTLALATPADVGYLYVQFMNASETDTTSSGTAVGGSMVVKITSGPGFLSLNGAGNTNLRQVTMTASTDVVHLWSDGTSGITTITGYVGTEALTSAAKSVTFYGKATTLTATANTITAAGWNLSSAAADSVTVGASIVTFVAKDASNIAVPNASQNRNGSFYLISSDTSVVAPYSASTFDVKGYGTCTAPTTVANIAAGKWSCSMIVRDSGTVTLTVADDTKTATATYTSAAVSVTAAGAAYTTAISFDKAIYAPGDAAIMTITAKDRAGRYVGQSAFAGSPIDPTGITLFEQNKPLLTGPSGASTGTTTLLTVDTYMGSSATFRGGIETAVTYMPTTPGKVTITGYTSYESSTVNSKIDVSVSVIDGNVTAAKDAADAATDAALEATDAAYAATDAANIAAEAADAATAAAEAATEAANAAKESADAATAAVEELATSVAKLMAALQAQITTLAKVVAKIAVKVKA